MTDMEMQRPEVRCGTRVGLFEVVSKIGAGGYADVYKVKRGHHFYALKLGRTRPDGDPESEATRHDLRLVRESACLRLVNAPGVVRVYDSGRWPDLENGWSYFIMELVHGAPLHVWARSRKPSPRMIVQAFVQLARAVQALHDHGIFHRDLKSQNVLVTGKGELKVIDLSVALMPALPPLTVTGSLVGTRTHMSPEVLAFVQDDERPSGSRFAYKATADLHAVGYLLYHVLTGRPPFDTQQPYFELYEQIKEKVPDRPRDINPRVPEALEALAMRLLEKDPGRRPQTALELAEKLAEEAALADGSWDEPLEVPPWTPEKVFLGYGTEQPEGAGKKQRWRRAVAAAAVVACLVPLAYLAAGNHFPRLAHPAGWQAPWLPSVQAGQASGSESFNRSQEGEALRTATSRPLSSRGLEPFVAAKVASYCAALIVAACPGAQPRPDGLPGGVTCPPKASNPLGVKALPDRPLGGEFTKVPGRTVAYTPAATSDERAEVFACRVGWDRACSWVREGRVEARIDGWAPEDSAPAVIPRPTNWGQHPLWGEARADGDRFYFVFTHLRLPDGRVVPLCGLSHDRRANQEHPPYYKILKRENGRFLIDGPVNEVNVYLLEDF